MPNYREEPDGSVRKQCSKCKEWRRPEGFSHNPRSADLLQSWCIRCHSQATRARRGKLTQAQLAERRKRRRLEPAEKARATKYFSEIDGGY